MYRLRDTRVILAIVLFLSWVASGGGFYLYKTTMDTAIADKQLQVEHLEESLHQIGELVPAFRVRAGVPAGKKVEETDLEKVLIPIGISEGIIGDLADAVGKFYKIPLSIGALLTPDSIYRQVITDDARFLDIVVHTMPIGLRPGAFVDVRILMPTGQDFLALSQKKVIEVNRGILKIMVNEKDIHTYNSMLLDSIMYRGTQIYAIEYVLGPAQRAAVVDYPISGNVLAVMRNSPNLLSAIQADILQRRGILEVGLSQLAIQDGRTLTQVIEQGRMEMIRSFAAVQADIDRTRLAFEEEQRRAAAAAGR